jgi:tRNA(adenine34) deaminase
VQRQDEEMIGTVIAEAQRAIQMGKAGVAALLLYEGEILALGHNTSQETGDMTAHAEMVVLREAAFRLGQMSDADKARVTIYCTLEPCLMCTAAISFVGIKRVVYSALTEDLNEEQMIARDITIETINPLLTRGPLELVPGVRRKDGQQLLAAMNKQG